MHTEQKRRVIVVGAGPAGMLAACRAAEGGAAVRLYEKNDRVGKKLAITGKGRCNLTNNCSASEVLEATRRNPRFLQSALHAFPPSAAMELFESLGCPLKTERGGRVFPVSDRAADVVGTLKRYLTRCGAELVHGTVTGLLLSQDKTRCCGVLTAHGEAQADCVILACGGLSYPATGSTGDGYRFAEEAGHTIISPAPSLIPIECAEKDCAAMAGLAPKNTALRITVGQDGKTVYSDFGEMLFTHFGVSGPMILSASADLEEKELPRAGRKNIKCAHSFRFFGKCKPRFSEFARGASAPRPDWPGDRPLRYPPAPKGASDHQRAAPRPVPRDQGFYAASHKISPY